MFTSFLCQALPQRAVTLAFARHFSHTPVVQARKKAISAAKKKASAGPTKKALAAKERKRVAKRKREIETLNRDGLPLEEAVRVLRAFEVSRPWSTLELTVRTAMGKGIPIPKGRMNLPKEVKSGKKDVILVFAEGEKAQEARAAGATVVGGTELIEGVVNGTYNPTVVLCTPDLIRQITPKLGRILGPRGLMPAVRRGTVTEDLRQYIKRLNDTSEWKADSTGNIRLAVGRIDFPVEDVALNVRHFMANAKQVVEQKSGTHTYARECFSIPTRCIEMLKRLQPITSPK